MGSKQATFDPYVVNNPLSLVRGPTLGKVLVVGPTFQGYRGILRQVHMDGVMPGVIHMVIPQRDIVKYTECENTACASFIQSIKSEMLAHGATELAVQWALETEPTLFSAKELIIMAEKLQKKGAAKAPAAAAEKTAPAKGKGNPAALEKAREAQAGKKAEQLADKRKITITDKGAEKLKKGGESSAVTNLAAMKAAKTVGNAIEGGLAMADINYAVKSETITLG